MKKIVFIMFFGVVFTHNLISQNRIDRPLQVQLDFSGVFLATFGENEKLPLSYHLLAFSFLPGEIKRIY